MILHGSIERFDLASVLQFLAQNSATGIVEIRDYEEHGHIYLVRGRLEAISLPVTDDRLGVFLLKHGVLTEPHLAAVLMEEAAGRDNGENRAPLGQRLVEKGYVSEAIVQKAMRSLIVARMFELTQWRSGVFSYDEPEHMPEFRISVSGNVQELLLQAQVRIDHGFKPRKRAPVNQEPGHCHGCTVADCTPEVKLKYLKKDTCLWRTMSSPPEISIQSRSEMQSPVVSIYAEEEREGAALLGRWGQL